jgi:protein SCO1/2
MSGATARGRTPPARAPRPRTVGAGPGSAAAVVALLAVSVLADCAPRSGSREPAGRAAPARTPAAPSLYELDFALTDVDGRRRTLTEFRGQPFVASMVYTSCTSICPRVTADLRALERALPPSRRAITRFVLFSLDPGRDTPAVLARFADEHGLDRGRWTLLASSEDDMRTLAAVLGVRFRQDPGGEIAHSAVIVVVDGEGSLRHRREGLSGDLRPLLAALEDAGS